MKLNNQCVDNLLGGYTTHWPSDEIVPIFDACQKYQSENANLVVVAGKEYGTGSSRDWAAKGTMMLGIKAVIAESFERIHRSNLIGMGILPCQFINEDLSKLSLTGQERISIEGIDGMQKTNEELVMVIESMGGKAERVKIKARLDTKRELEYYQSDGILSYVLKGIIANEA